MKEEVAKIIDDIRPNLQQDGGDVELVDVVDNVVKVRLKGACAGCMHAQMTLKMGIERTIKEKLPEITAVEAV